MSIQMTQDGLSRRNLRVVGVAAGLLLALSLIGLGCNGKADERPADDPEQLPSILFASKEGEAIATVGDDVILTVDELKARIAQQSPFMRQRFQTEEGRRELVDQLVQFEILAREAARQGLHLEPAAQQALKQTMVNQLLSGRLERPTEAADIPEERLREYYEENISDFVQPERVRVSHVLIETGDDLDAARAKAAEHLSELREGRGDAGAFSRLARTVSEHDESASVGGDLRYQSEEQLVEAWGSEMASAAFALDKVGAISEVVEGEKGLHIIRLVGRQRASERKFEDVRPQLLNRLQRQERNVSFKSFVDELGERDGLTVNEDVLERFTLAASEPEADED